jgi:galactokinase
MVERSRTYWVDFHSSIPGRKNISEATDKAARRSISLPNLAASTVDTFQSHFQHPASVVVAAPGRVNLIGEHIDYNDGFVLPFAIERYVCIAAHPRDSSSAHACTLHSANLNESVTIPLNETLEPGIRDWSMYPRGVLVAFQERDIAIPPFNAVIQSNVPMGSGLSSSAALEVAMATLLESLTGTDLDPTYKALLCQQAEHRFAGVPCGIMDQFSSVFGMPDELMFIDCVSQEVESIPFDREDFTVLITHSNAQHKLVDGQYAERRSECASALTKLKQSTWRDLSTADLDSGRSALSDTEYRRARHVVSEIERTRQAADLLRQGRWEDMGPLLYASHDSLRNDYEVSCDELDVLIELTKEIGASGGVLGAKMTGAGFGGCIVTLAHKEKVDAIAQSIHTEYEARTGIKPFSFTSRPARGAHRIEG